MGRKGSILVPFLREALECGKYGTALVYDCKLNSTFKITLERKSTSLNTDSVRMLQDWNIIKGRKLSCETNYSMAKQGLLMALKRSKYLKFVPSSKKDVTYRFLSEEEIADKTKSKIEQPSFAESSDYGSSSLLEAIALEEYFNIKSEYLSRSTGTGIQVLQIRNGQYSCDNIDVPGNEKFLDFKRMDTNQPVSLDELARLVDDPKWNEMKNVLFSESESLECEPRSTELRLYRYKSEEVRGNNVIISCELEKNEYHELNLDNTEFIKGYPGVLANADLLKRLMSCHVNVKQLGEDRLELLLTSNSERNVYSSFVICDKFIFRSSQFFIVTKEVT